MPLARDAQTIKLGEINEYKQFPAFLDPYRKGMELAVEEINAAGGVLGRKIEVVSRDDNGVPGDAVRAAEELLTRERAALLMGTFASNIGLAVADLAKRRHVLFIAAEPLTDKLVWEDGNKYTFRLRASTYMQTAMLVPEAVKLGEKALGDRLSELRVRAGGDRDVQAADAGAAGRRPRIRRAGGAARQDRAGRRSCRH